jgi:SET domain-containing protein
MYTNHSSTPNIKYKYDYNAKVKTTLAARDIARGDELLQDYGSFSKVEWFTEYIKESTNGLSSVIEFDGSF